MLKKLIRKNEQTISINLTERIKRAQQEQLPSHIAIIMDGNGRWAKKRTLPRVAGHHEGMKIVKRITRFANEIGIKTLTLYAFSTENWKRPKLEVEFLMRLPEEFLGTYLPELIEQNVQVKMMGNIESLPEHTKRAVKKAMEQTAHNDGLILNFALNYGSRDEIVQAVRNIVSDVQDGNISAEVISEKLLDNYLMTKDLSEPDLLIRTSGEVRLSNFMLWQLAYTEFWFTDTLWPDFDEACLLDAIESYQTRNRRYGGLKGEEVN
ncbi:MULTISPECIES: isoprenyl transferase [Bacillaceae]|uniref:isoprenyl transferase n=1 Tax=Bacillaceae TaxID=186817 RepID=UPI0006FE51C5|nr:MULTISPECIES: isoprenyl transferase [Bacillaceae]KQL35543.1 UDP pyrophosphate synthase [Psychrobacillus sp. FJAT-21963]MDF2066046.1 isoprenyl transferase [Bacillus sp. Cr_A10]